MRDLIRSITRNSDDYDEKHMKIKINSDDDLPLNKMLEICSMIIAIRVVFHKYNKYYMKVFLLRWTFVWIMNNIKMLYYDRISVFEGIHSNKTSESKECDICYYLYLLDKAFSFQPDVWNGCHDLLMMSVNLNGIVNLNITCGDYHWVISRINKSEVINLQ